MTQPPGIQYASIDPQNAADITHLRTLAICHYIWGGLTIAFSSIFIIHVILGIAMMSGAIPPPAGGTGPPPPTWMGLVFAGFGGALVVLGWTTGILTIYSGRCLVNRRRRTFSLVMAGVNCISVPFGTLLGVFTFIVLFRPSVRMMYEGPRT